MCPAPVMLSHFVRPPQCHKRAIAFLYPTSVFRHLLPLPRPPFPSRLVPLQRRQLVTSAAKVQSSSSSPSSPKSSKSSKSSSKRTFSSSSSSSSSESTLVIVESPTKATTIQSILPSTEYIVRSCVGHIREIPSSAKRIPAKYKQLDWAFLGVDVQSDFRPIYVLIPGKKAIITDLRKQLSTASKLILATDDDREGEAISWHLLQVLKPSIPVHRAVFHEITPDAVRSAFNNFRELDMALVDAQETRRVLDRLAGYTMSPLLWKKIARGLSAGRVQSVAMAEIVRRERQRLEFIAARYSSACVTLSVSDGHVKKQKDGQSMSFDATLTSVDGVRLVKGSDFDDNTGKLNKSMDPSSVLVFNTRQMQRLCEALQNNAENIVVTQVECRKSTRNPPLPLITSTLQQECGNRLGMGAGRTMSIAQRLYETGVITYMRTDNPTLSEDAVAIARTKIKQLYGEESLWDGSGRTRMSSKKPKAAQAAHEAIRPAGSDFIHPDVLTSLDDAERAVYTIIYRRALASQMASAKLDQTTVRLTARVPKAFMSDDDVTHLADHNDDDDEEVTVEFKATGSVIVEPGFLQLYQDVDTSNGASDGSSSSSSFLPPLVTNDTVDVCSTTVLNHETKPPPRFNDASLVKVLEERGVGRPSTYAGIIEILITRGYVYRGRDLPIDKKVPPKSLVPSLTAFAVENLLSTHFPSFVDAQFTARMEQALDDIAAGSGNRVSYLKEYYNGEHGLAESVQRTEKDIDARRFRHVILPNMPSGMIEQQNLIASTDKISSTSPKKRGRKKATKQDKSDERSNDVAAGNKDEGKFTMCKMEDGSIDWSRTKLLVNSYGPYVEQNGIVVASLPKTTVADDLSAPRLQSALLLAEDPVIGKDPESGLDVLLKTSKFGQYVQLGHEHEVEKGMKPKRCGLNRLDIDASQLSVDLALKLLSLPRLLGRHPTTDLEIRAAMGPYGPYVAHDTQTFVSLKKDMYNVLDITFEEALQLVDAAEERKRRRAERRVEREKEKEKEKEKAKRRRSSSVRVKG